MSELKAYVVGKEMNEEEKAAWENVPSLVTPVEKIETLSRSETQEPTNIEAIVEGLLYIVGEDGVKKEAIAAAIDKSIEDTEVILLTGECFRSLLMRENFLSKIWITFLYLISKKQSKTN